jgi:hypothetical protein
VLPDDVGFNVGVDVGTVFVGRININVGVDEGASVGERVGRGVNVRVEVGG